MTTFKNDPLSYKEIGCALEVYKTLGPGLLEKVYQKASLSAISRNACVSIQNKGPISFTKLSGFCVHKTTSL